MRVSSQQPPLQAAAERKEKTKQKAQLATSGVGADSRLTYDLQLCPHGVTVGCAGLGDTTGHLT